MKTLCLAAAMVACGASAQLANPALNPVRFHEAPGHEALTLVAPGAPATIVVADGTLADREAVTTVAARELAELVGLSTGVEPTIVEVAEAPASGPVILVGVSALSEELGIGAGDLPLEGFRVQSFAAAGGRYGVAIVGRMPEGNEPDAPNGTLWGVYDWLERVVGIRWYYPNEDGRVVPRHESLIMPATHYTDAPHTLKRTLYGPTKGYDWKRMERWLRAGNSSPTPGTYCHSPASWSIHYEEYPETFELQLDGSRSTFMPCYGNPKTAEVYLEDLERFYRDGDWAVWKHPSANSPWHGPSGNVIPVSPPDKGVACVCEYCKVLFDNDAPSYARASRVVAHHVRLVAEGARERWPEKVVWYLPYSNYTVPPADLELPDNVIAGICLMYGAGNAKEPSLSAIHDQWIADWQRITGRPVHLWEYQCWPADDTSLPFQYPHVLQSFYQRHREDVEGSFINFGYAPAGLKGGSYATTHPTIYVWLRLMWNPDFDVDAALAEYTALMYGPAAGPMGMLLSTLTHRWEDTRWETPPGSHRISPRHVHEETMPRAEALKLAAFLDQARRLAGEDTLWRRRVDFLGDAVDIFLEESRDYHEGTGRPVLPVLRVGDIPEIDGRLDDLAWGDAPQQAFVNATDMTQPEPEAATFLRAIWTDTGIAFGLRCSEPLPEKIRATRSVHDQDVYVDDCVELFIDAAGTRAEYAQIVVNSLGAVFDRHSDEGADWNVAGLRSAAHVGEDYWSVEVFIPFGSLPGLEKGPKVGDLWYANFTRSRHAGGAFQLTRWSTRHQPSNLDFSAFGQLRFVE